jgi:hypothetical protein
MRNSFLFDIRYLPPDVDLRKRESNMTTVGSFYHLS